MVSDKKKITVPTLKSVIGLGLQAEKTVVALGLWAEKRVVAPALQAEELRPEPGQACPKVIWGGKHRSSAQLSALVRAINPRTEASLSQRDTIATAGSLPKQKVVFLNAQSFSLTLLVRDRNKVFTTPLAHQECAFFPCTSKKACP